MYRIFCESYNNYIKSFEQPNIRLDFAAPFKLIVDISKFETEQQNNTIDYQTLCDLLYYASQNLDRYPRLKAFLWTISSRGMEPQYFGVTDNAVLEEQVKLLNSFLKLTYWA
jgi:hypothetical protein